MSKADRRLVTGDVHQQWPHARQLRERAASSHPPSRTLGTLSPYKQQVQQKTSGCRLGLDKGGQTETEGHSTGPQALALVWLRPTLHPVMPSNFKLPRE